MFTRNLLLTLLVFSALPMMVFGQTFSNSIRIFHNTSTIQQHPQVVVTVPQGYKILGGGAIVHWSGAGNLLLASYPETVKRWVAKSKDHNVGSPASITAYAIALYDPHDSWDVQIFSRTTDVPVTHPIITVSLPTGYVLTGGGARSHSINPGNLLTASYPKNSNTWEARSKDHSVQSPSLLSVYAIGIKSRIGNVVPQVVVTQSTGDIAQHPSAQVSVQSGFTMTGGGAKDNWNGAGNLLTASYPSGNNIWVALGKDHEVASPADITVYAIGIR
jgi:hypothetical protein